MPKWEPDPNEPIGLKESLGRRLFGQPPLAGAIGQKLDPKAMLKSLDLRDFEDQRDGEVSLDRLARAGSPEKAVVTYLVPRAEADGKKRAPVKTFNGWAAVQAKILMNNSKFPLAVIASPIEGNGLQDNLYHSHIKALQGDDPYRVALHLRELYQKHGSIHLSPNNPSKSGWIRACFLSVSHWFLWLADKF